MRAIKKHTTLEQMSRAGRGLAIPPAGTGSSFTATKAHNMVKRAIKNGWLVPQPCEVCGATKRIHAHHEDYNYPMQIQWLCTAHHFQEHWALWSDSERQAVIASRPKPKGRARTKVRPALPPGVTGPRQSRYSATGRDQFDRLVHLGFFKTIELAKIAVEMHRERIGNS